MFFKCSLNDKVSDLIQEFRKRENYYDENIKFIFNAKALCSDLTVSEAGLSEGANIFVVMTKGI